MEQAIQAVLTTQRQLAESQVHMMRLLANAPGGAGGVADVKLRPYAEGEDQRRPEE